MTRNGKLVLYVFFLLYFLAGIWHAVPIKVFRGLLFDLYLMAPFLVIVTGFFVQLAGKNPSVFLWMCSLYWLYAGLGETIEDGFTDVFIGFEIMAIVSILCIIFLVCQHVNKRKMREAYG
jgi:hypothetical protein